MQDLENTVAADAVTPYGIAKGNGRAMAVCVQAGLVTAAYRPATEEEHDDWLTSLGLSDHYHDLPTRRKLSAHVDGGRPADRGDQGSAAREKPLQPYGSSIAVAVAAAILLTAAIALILTF